MKYINWIVLALAIIGCLNWGLIALADFNLVTYLFGNGMMSRVIYGIVGLCGLYSLSFFTKVSKHSIN